MYSVTINVRKRHLALALAMLLVGVWITHTPSAGAGIAPPPGEGIAVVYVAVGTGFPDALGVGPGAGLDGAPIIIVPTDPPMNAATSAELVRLDPRSVVIVGGTAVVSAPMETAIGALLPNAVVSRIAGANRYETNAMFSEATFPIEGWISVPAGAFTTLNPDTDDATIGNNLAYNVTTGYLRAAIQLPQGAEILELQVHAYDTSGSNLVANLSRFDAFAGGLALMSIGTSDSPGDTTVTTTVMNFANTEIVDNHNYAYGIEVSGANSTSLLIRSVQVRYRLGASTG